MTVVALKAAGIAAPGLSGWTSASPVLAGAAAYLAAPEPAYAPAMLPPNERRRTTAAVRQAFRAAEDALAQGGTMADATALASVFASSDADMTVLHRICTALAAEPRVLSPTDFHNSVHNAASGYWSIAAHCMRPTTTLAAYDASFTAGLLEAAALVRDLDADVLLVAYDAVAPEPLFAKRALASSASVALILGPHNSSSPSQRLAIDIGGDGETPCTGNLETLRTGNPALRALPLLELVARGVAGEVVLRGTGNLRVRVGYSP
jgi:3-oxoacyl-(acyl-carrier-protein) synthase